jgi:ketosteroid isomerase-like protein
MNFHHQLLSAVVASGVMLISVATTPSASASASGTRVPASAVDQNRQIVADAFTRWAAGGNNFFAEVLDADVVWTIEGSGPSAGRHAGRQNFVDQAVRPFVSRLSQPVRPVSQQVWADGEHVIVHWEGKGVARDGVPYHNRYAWILRMRDGKAVEVTAFLDLAPYDDVLRRVPLPQP